MSCSLEFSVDIVPSIYKYYSGVVASAPSQKESPQEDNSFYLLRISSFSLGYSHMMYCCGRYCPVGSITNYKRM
jgi:hypothetical protein